MFPISSLLRPLDKLHYETRLCNALSCLLRFAQTLQTATVSQRSAAAPKRFPTKHNQGPMEQRRRKVTGRSQGRAAQSAPASPAGVRLERPAVDGPLAPPDQIVISPLPDVILGAVSKHRTNI